MEITTFTKQEIDLLNKRVGYYKQYSNGCLITLLVTIFILIVVLVFFGDKGLTIIPLLLAICFLFIVRKVKNTIATTISDSLIDGRKVLGYSKIIKKEEIDHGDYSFTFSINFEDVDFGPLNFKKKFWEKLKINDVIYIEQTKVNNYIFVLLKDNIQIQKELEVANYNLFLES